MSFKHSTISCTSMLPYLFLYFLTLLSLAPDRLDITPPCRNGYLTLMPGNLLECPTRRWWGDSILLSLSLSIYCIGQERVINGHTNLVGTQIQGSFVRMANLMIKDRRGKKAKCQAQERCVKKHETDQSRAYTEDAFWIEM